MKKLTYLATILFCSIAFSQNVEKFTIQEVQKELKSKKYSPKVLSKFIAEFPEENKNYIYDIVEQIPGEIISFTYESGTAMSRSTFAYQVKGENLIPLKIYPEDENGNIDKLFAEKVSKFAGKNWRFESRAGYTISKFKNGMYKISTNYYKESEPSVAPTGYIEYLTSDFKNFSPYKISNEYSKKMKKIN